MLQLGVRLHHFDDILHPFLNLPFQAANLFVHLSQIRIVGDFLHLEIVVFGSIFTDTYDSMLLA